MSAGKQHHPDPRGPGRRGRAGPRGESSTGCADVTTPGQRRPRPYPPPRHVRPADPRRPTAGVGPLRRGVLHRVRRPRASSPPGTPHGTASTSACPWAGRRTRCSTSTRCRAPCAPPGAAVRSARSSTTSSPRPAGRRPRGRCSTRRASSTPRSVPSARARPSPSSWRTQTGTICCRSRRATGDPAPTLAEARAGLIEHAAQAARVAAPRRGHPRPRPRRGDRRAPQRDRPPRPPSHTRPTGLARLRHTGVAPPLHRDARPAAHPDADRLGAADPLRRLGARAQPGRRGRLGEGLPAQGHRDLPGSTPARLPLRLPVERLRASTSPSSTPTPSGTPTTCGR